MAEAAEGAAPGDDTAVGVVADLSAANEDVPVS